MNNNKFVLALPSKGFSLVETLLATFVFYTILVGVFQFLSQSNARLSSLYFTSIAQQIAQESLEVVTSFGYQSIKDNLDTGIGEYVFNKWTIIEPFSPHTGVERPEHSSLFMREIEVTNLSLSPSKLTSNSVSSLADAFAVTINVEECGSGRGFRRRRDTIKAKKTALILRERGSN